MLLLTALMSSMHQIAFRRRDRGSKTNTYEFYFAVVSKRGKAHIINGRNGSIRRLDATDQSRTDWEPFQPMPEKKGWHSRKPLIPEKPQEKP